MLALIAIDAFVDRVDSSRAVERELGKIHQRLTVSDSSGIRFAQRIEQEKIEDLIGSARKTLWIAGPSNDGIVQRLDEIRDRLQHGVQVRILMVYPTDELIEWYGRHAVGPTYRLSDPAGRARAKARLEDNRDRLIELKEVVGGTYEMRVLERIMWFGFIIIDAGERDQRMDVQVYSAKRFGSRAGLRCSPMEVAPVTPRHREHRRGLRSGGHLAVDEMGVPGTDTHRSRRHAPACRCPDLIQ
jgi:hypothetical protein